MAVITISRQFGAGGKTLGKKVADALGYTFAHTEIIQKIAEMARVSPAWVESVEKEAGGRLQRVVSKMVSKPLLERVLKDEQGYIDEEIYIDYLVVLINQMAEEDNIVFLGRGSQYILNDLPGAFHILLINTFKNRVRFMMDNYDMTEKSATQLVKNEEKRRSNLYKKIGKQDYDKPDLYHLVINMARVDLDHAAQLIYDLIGHKN